MAKIPRMDASVPSVAEGMEYAEQIGKPGSAAGIVELGAKVTGVLAGEFRAAEVKEAERLRKYREEKQAIIDNVTAAKIELQYDADTAEASKTLQDQYFDNPEAVLEPFQAALQSRLETEVSSAPTPGVAAKLSSAIARRNAARMNEMREWQMGRTTQKAQNDLTEALNRTANAAGRIGSIGGLEKHLAESEALLAPRLNQVFGSAAAGKLSEWKSNATENFIRSFYGKKRDPVTGKNLLESATGPVQEYLNGDQRERLLEKMDGAIIGNGLEREVDLVYQGLSRYSDLHQEFVRGNLDAEGIATHIDAEQEHIRAIKVDPKYTKEQRAAQVKIVESRIRVLDAIEDITRRRTDLDAIDAPLIMEKIISEQKRLVGKGGRDPERQSLLALQEHLENLAKATRRGPLKRDTYDAMVQPLMLAIGKALKREKKNTAWLFPNAYNQGIRALNARFETALRGQPIEIQNAAYIQYIKDMAAFEQNTGREPSDAEAVDMARRAADSLASIRPTGAP